MYLPKHFEAGSTAEIHALIRQHPFGALVTHGVNGLDANHLPFDLAAEAGPYGTLSAHVARANPVWRELKDGDDVLVIFQVGDAYISPNWYPSKHETHRQVPTWNYRVVHAHGKARIRDDEKFVRGVVARLTREHEARMQEPRPWKMGDSEPAFIDGMLAAIVGLEVEITRLVGKSKLSQNKETRDRQGASDALRRHAQDAIAEAMAATIERKG